MSGLAPLLDLAMALAVGLLIGIERGWQERAMAEGSRPAGIRTFALVGLLGGLTAVLAPALGAAPFLAAFALVGAFAVAAYLREAEQPTGRGITTHVALLIAFALGAIAGIGELELAASAAVVTTLLLGLKPVMHGWLRRISGAELMAGLKLLVMTVVLLPVLPDRGFGPWEALNPYRIWWLVVLIAATSFLGYAAARLLGARRGIATAGACGGLASSTAVTLTFARFARQRPDRAMLFGGGALIASAVMCPRLLAIVAIAAPGFAGTIAAPLMGAGLAGGIVAAIALRRERDPAPDQAGAAIELIGNPLELGTALKFGVLLAAVMLAARALDAWAGQGGLVLLGAVSGLVDVDAVSLSVANMVPGGVSHDIGALAVLTAVLVNTLVKGTMLAVIGGRRLVPLAVAGVLAMIAGAVAGLALVPLGLVFTP